MGTGAHAAAAKHGKFELEKLANWKAGEPVPFAFLADTFEAIAEESKRLVITNLLVGASFVLLQTAAFFVGGFVTCCTLCTAWKSR